MELPLMLVLLLLLPVCSSQFDNYAGTVTTYYPKYNDTDGSLSVELRFKLNGQICYNYPWRCLSEDCGTPVSDITYPVDYHIKLPFCQLESIWVQRVSTEAPFQTQLLLPTESSFLWSTPVVNGVRNIKALTVVELRKRSDTGKPNRSPQTTILPIIRVPSNCQRDVRLLAYDPDGDLVKCRYADSRIHPEECAQCTRPSVLRLSSTCTLSFTPTHKSSIGQYAVQLMMEDFPRSKIHLKLSSGAKEVKSTTNTISQIPVQFLFSVEAAAPSCTKGLYLPKFVEPTPQHGAKLNVNVGEHFELAVKAKATVSTITEMLFSGPYNTYVLGPDNGLYIFGWRPLADQVGNTYPVCFIAEAVAGSTKYHSDLRCVIVNVKKASPTPPSTTTPISTTTKPTSASNATSNLTTVTAKPGNATAVSTPTPISASNATNNLTTVTAKPTNATAVSNPTPISASAKPTNATVVSKPKR